MGKIISHNLQTLEKMMMNAELVLIVIDGNIRVVKNRNLMTRSQLIDKLDELKLAKD